MPPYFADPNAYKKLVDADTLKALQRYRTMPRVKIPLEFNKQGNPVVAKVKAEPAVK